LTQKFSCGSVRSTCSWLHVDPYNAFIKSVCLSTLARFTSLLCLSLILCPNCCFRRRWKIYCVWRFIRKQLCRRKVCCWRRSFTWKLHCETGVPAFEWRVSKRSLWFMLTLYDKNLPKSVCEWTQITKTCILHYMPWRHTGGVQTKLHSFLNPALDGTEWWTLSGSWSVTLLSFVVWPVLHQVHSLFQSLFSTECDMVLSLSISSILSFPEGHPVAAYVFFFVFPSLISFLLSFLH
jgi:hypothetical protein